MVVAEMDPEQVLHMSPNERAQYDLLVGERVIRFSQVRPNWLISPNCKLPGYERANFVYVGSGPYVKSQSIPDGQGSEYSKTVPGENYSVVILLCEPSKGAPLHAHTTEEMFIALSGRWAVYWGNDAQNEVILDRWDAIWIPAPVMRGFRNVGTESACLLSIIGGGSPPPPIPHPKVTEALAQMGLGPSWVATVADGRGEERS
jgi:mannose-6-phosphate isomerase-like protein (cupin superfamily)